MDVTSRDISQLLSGGPDAGHAEVELWHLKARLAPKPYGRRLSRCLLHEGHEEAAKAT